MAHKNNILFFLAFSLVAPAYAADVAQTLPAGTVACLNRKSAEDYKVYTQKAPDFAKELLARDTCFAQAKDEEAVRLGAEKGFTKLKLLSGHVVWVPEKR